jgi:hypothetical protein
MAHAAYRQAAKLSSFGTDVVGVGCTCALATDREKRGEHKAFITTYNGLQERSFSLLLAKGARSRLGEDTLVSKLLIRAVAESMGLSAQVCVCVGGGGLGVERRAALRLHKHATLDVGAAWPVPFAACQTATHNALAARAVLASAC